MIPKFRVYDKIFKIIRPVATINFDAEEVSYWFTDSGETYCPFTECVLMQSTGLFDKNGKEIFEGDVIKPLGFASWIGVVGYASDKAAYILKDHDNDFLRDEPVYLSQFCEGLEVLGNIYENPELLEKR